MYFALKEHNPPHFHVYYNEYKVSFDIKAMTFMNGDLPAKQKKLAQVWAELHKDELLADWELAANGETVYKITPLS